MSTLLQQAISRFNEINAQDPHTTFVDGIARPRELLAAERLEAWIYKVASSPSDALKLAARCQHLSRFSFPRSDYPEGRVGYLKWRKDLSRKHADRTTAVLRDLGANEDLIQQVRTINLKEGLKTNPDTQAMEDALCLTFLEHEYAEFAVQHPDDKVVEIIQKTWQKMSERGHTLALTLHLDGRSGELVRRALS